MDKTHFEIGHRVEEPYKVRIVNEGSAFYGEVGEVRKEYRDGEVDVYMASIGEETFFFAQDVERIEK